MRLVLFRHGPAGDRDPVRWPDDRLRPLTDKGTARTRQVALAIAGLEKSLGHVFTSSYDRAEQSARLLADAAELETPTVLEALEPGGSWRDTIAAIAERLEQSLLEESDTVALVGHEPEMGKLAGVLLFGAPQSLPLKKAGACAIDFDGAPEPGAGQLRWFVGPRVLRSLAGRKAKAKA